ncbi:MAG: hypothetical protein ACYSTY_02795 [Planctomycetota bacterium]|jgi:hypothetical protein
MNLVELVPALRPRLIHGLALAVALGLTAPGQGQFGQAAGFAESMQQDFMRRDLVIFQEVLALDVSQRVIVEALFEDYQDAFAVGLQGMREEFRELTQELQTGDLERIMTLIFVPFEKWGRDKEQLRARFIENVKVLLTEDQIAQWPALERQLLRNKTLAKGQFSGERTNLLHMVRDLHLEEFVLASIQPLLLEYELELDRVLRHRNSVISSSQGPLIKALQQDDGKLGVDVIDRQIEARLAVRDTNDRYMELIAAALPTELGREFLEKARERGYPRIYRGTNVQRVLKAAIEIPDLEADVRTDVQELYASYAGELERMNEALRRSLREAEPQLARERAMQFAARRSGVPVERKPDPTRTAFQRRREMGQRHMKLLEGILTPEQFAALPGASRLVKNPQAEREAKKRPYDAEKRMREKKRSDAGEGGASPALRGKSRDDRN